MRSLLLPLLLLFATAALGFPDGELNLWRQQMLDDPQGSLQQATEQLNSPFPQKQLMAQLVIAEVHAWQGLGQAAREQAMAGLSESRAQTQAGFEVAFYNVLARADRLLGNMDGAHNWSQKAAQALSQLDEPMLTVDQQSELGETYLKQSQYGKALAAFENAYQAALPLQNDDIINPILNYLALAYDSLEQFDIAAGYYRKILASLGENSSRSARSILYYNLAVAEKALDEHEQAKEHLHHARALAEQTGNQQSQAFIDSQLAHYALKDGQLDQARQLLASTEQIFSQLGNDYQLTQSRLLQVKVAIAQGELDKARALLTEVGQAVSHQDDDNLRRALLEVELQWHTQAGHYQDALATASKLRALENQLMENKLTIAREAMTSRVSFLEKSRELDKLKNQSLLVQERQRYERFVFLVATAVLAVLLFNAYFWLRRERGNLKLMGAMAHQDELTGQPNRRAILADLQHKLDSKNSMPLSVVLIDLDHFKQINDSHGHEGGDLALCHFAKVASQCLRQQDSLGRLGGEEWLLLLPFTDLDRARDVVSRLQQSLRDNLLHYQGKRIRLQLSAGLTLAQANESTAQVLKRADKAMYQAKDAGRNRFVILPAAEPSR